MSEKSIKKSESEPFAEKLLKPDGFWRLLDAPFPTRESIATRAAQLHERFAALAGLSAENMGRTAGWRFLDLGRRIERAITVCRLLRALGSDASSAG